MSRNSLDHDVDSWRAFLGLGFGVYVSESIVVGAYLAVADRALYHVKATGRAGVGAMPIDGSPTRLSESEPSVGMLSGGRR